MKLEERENLVAEKTEYRQTTFLENLDESAKDDNS